MTKDKCVESFLVVFLLSVCFCLDLNTVVLLKCTIRTWCIIRAIIKKDKSREVMASRTKDMLEPCPFFIQVHVLQSTMCDERMDGKSLKEKKNKSTLLSRQLLAQGGWNDFAISVATLHFKQSSEIELPRRIKHGVFVTFLFHSGTVWFHQTYKLCKVLLNTPKPMGV